MANAPNPAPALHRSTSPDTETDVMTAIRSRPRHAPTGAGAITRMALRDFSAFGVSLIPFALTIGAASASNDLSLTETLFGAVFLLAGTAQLAATELLGRGAAAPVVVATILVINVRFVLYSAGLARWFSDAPRGQKMLLAAPLVDQSFLCCEERFKSLTGLAARRRYYLSGTALLAALFIAGQLVGYFVGPSLPESLGLHLAAPLVFAGMLVKSMHCMRNVVAAGTAAVVVVACAALPAGLALPVAVIAGLVAGERLQEGSQ